MEAGLDITYVGGAQNGPNTLPGTSIPFPRSHQGHSGETIEQINNRVNGGVMNVNPHIVLLHIGTNDMRLSPSGAPARLGTLIDNIINRAPNALLVVSTIVPWPGMSGNVSQYNSQIPNVVEQRRLQGKNIVFVDQFTGFPNSELADGVHPNPAVYARMAGKWYGAIYEHLVNIN